MHMFLLKCLTLTGFFVAVTRGAAPPAYNKSTTKKIGTWTYYSTSTVTTTIPTVTWAYLDYDDRRTTVTNTSTVTYTNTYYDDYFYDFTATTTTTSTYIAGTTIVDPPPATTRTSIVTVPVSSSSPSNVFPNP